MTGEQKLSDGSGKRLGCGGIFVGALLCMLLVVSLVTAALFAIGRIESTYLTNLASQYLSDELQREVRIDGSLRIGIGRTLELSVNDVSIASVDWSQSDTLLRIVSAEIQVDALSLIAEETVVESLSVRGLQVNLEENDDGANNWTLGPPENDTEIDTRPQIPVRFNQLAVSDTEITLLTPELREHLVVQLETISQSIQPDQSAELRLNGDINDTPVSVVAFIANIANLNRLEEVDIRFEGDLGEISLDGDMYFEDLLNPSRPIASLKLNGPNVQYLTDIIGIDNMQPGPLLLTVSIAPRNETMEFSSVIDIGTLDLQASGYFDDLQILENANASFEIAAGNLGELAATFGIDGIPEQAFSMTGDLEKRGVVFDLPDMQLRLGDTTAAARIHFDKFPSPVGAAVDVTIEAPRIQDFGELTGLGDGLKGPLSASLALIALEDGSTDLSLVANSPETTVSAKGNIKDNPGFAGTSINVDFASDSLAKLVVLTGNEFTAPDIRVAIAADFARGNDSTEVRNGRIKLGQDTLKVEGRIGDEPLSPATQLDFDLKVPELGKTLGLFDVSTDTLPLAALQAKGNVVLARDGLSINKVAALVDDVTLEIDGTVTDLSTLPQATIDYAISGPDLARLIPGLDQYNAAQSPFSAAGALSIDKAEITLSNLTARISNGEVKGSIALDRNSPTKSIKVSLKAQSDDVFSLAAGIADIEGPANVPLRGEIDGKLVGNAIDLGEFNLKIGQAEFRAVGRITEPPNYTNTRLRVSASAPDISQIGLLAGMALPTDTLDASFALAGKRNELFIDDLRVQLGPSDLRGKLSLVNGDVPDLTFDLQSSLLDLSDYLSAGEDSGSSAAPAAQSSDGRLIPDTEIDIQALTAANVAFSFAAERVVDGPWQANDIELSGQLRDGALVVERFAFREKDGGDFSGRLGLAPKPDGPEFWLRLNGSSMSLGLPADSLADQEALPQYDMNLAFITNGPDVRTMAGAVNGYLKIVVGEGRIRTLGISLMTTDFLTQLLTTINPFLKNDPYTNLHCGVILASVEDGQLVGNPAVVAKSDKLKITAKTRIDLKSEKLTADINTVAQKGLGISLNDFINPYIQVKGTLSKPSLALDTQSTVVEGGAAVATGGISILVKNLADRFLSAKDPCGAAVSNAEKTFAELERKYASPQPNAD